MRFCCTVAIFALKFSVIMVKKSIFMLLAVVVVSSCGEKEHVEKAATRVKTEVAALATGESGRSYVGIVEERESTAVSFTGMGVVSRVLVSEGQRVAKGDLIAEMDNTQARNLLAAAEAQKAQADDAFARYRMLHDNGSLPEVQWVEIQSKVAQAESQLEVAKKNMQDCRLLAPVGGIVGKKMVKAGETALPSQAVVTIYDIVEVKVRVSIPETEIGAIGNRTASTVRVDAVGREYHGGIVEKGVVADALTHTYDVRIRVANDDQNLLPGMVADVTFASGNGGETVLLPIEALQRRSDGSLFVWTVGGDSTAHRTAVRIGRMNGNRVAVTDGITAGVRVVVEGYQKLSEGTKVVY